MERIVQIHVEDVETPYPVTALMVYAKMCWQPTDKCDIGM